MFKIEEPQQQRTPEKVIIIIYGQPGTGKTTMACSATAPILIDTDGGSHRMRKLDRVPTMHPETYQDILDFLKDEQLKRFKTIIFDTFGNLLTLIDDYVAKLAPSNTKSNGELSLAGYGVRKKVFINLLKELKRIGLSIIFVAHDKEESGDDDKKVIRILASGTSVNDLIREVDAIGYVEMLGKTRTICFNPTQKFYAKNSMNLPSPIKIPELKPDCPNDFIQKYIEAAIKSKIAEEEAEEQGDEQAKKILEILGQTDKKFFERLNEAKPLCTTLYLKKFLLAEAVKQGKAELGYDADKVKEILRGEK